MATLNELEAIFDRLKAIMQTVERRLQVEADAPNPYSLNTHKTGPNQRPMFFGAVHLRRHDVSCHLMPVYACSELLDTVSDALKRRMQGKSCFNFKHADDALFDELAALTRRGLEAFQAGGMA